MRVAGLQHISDAGREHPAHAGDLFVDTVGDPVRQPAQATGLSTPRLAPVALSSRNWRERERSARMISDTWRPWASPLKSATAIGYCVAPTPEMSTRSWAWACGAAIAMVAASTAPAQLRHDAA